ncbi:translation initiation factor IF-2-like [Pipra filicauda]|uniref:Translation initiation factor IF-2-like n=1 Tax=Pipra filicauda TaxID=649802 RepID=A0A7R5KZ53_9PASS|nr:translation initiation factor IF-2-like [Pipra filicauda]
MAKGQRQAKQRTWPCLQGGRPAPSRPAQPEAARRTLRDPCPGSCQGGAFAQRALLPPPLEREADALLPGSCLAVPLHGSAFFSEGSCQGRRTQLGLRSSESLHRRKAGPRGSCPGHHPPAHSQDPHTSTPPPNFSCSHRGVFPRRRCRPSLATPLPLSSPTASRRRTAQSQPLRGAGPSGQRQLGLGSSGQRACRPAYRGLRLLPGAQSARDTRALAPTYRGALGPKACGGSFSPLRGAPDPLPANGAVAPHRLPAEGAQRLPDPDPAYRRVHTQGATELGLPPQHQVPGSRARHWGSWPKALSWAPRAGRAHAQPHACERPGDPAGHPPDYRGSLQPPAEQGGRTKPHLGGRPPEARHSQQRPRGLRPPGTGPPAPRTGGGPRWHVASRTGSPAARVAVPAPPLTGFAPSSGTRGKPLSTLRPFWPVRSPGASLRLSSPARRRDQLGSHRQDKHHVPASSVRRAVGSRPCRRAGQESLGLAPGLRAGQKGLSALRGKGHGL